MMMEKLGKHTWHLFGILNLGFSPYYVAHLEPFSFKVREFDSYVADYFHIFYHRCCSICHWPSPKVLKSTLGLYFRLLTMISHMVIAVTLLFSREENVKHCLPLEHTRSEFEQKDMELTMGLGAAIGFIIIEFIGFLCGLSMFGTPTVTLISITAHTSATVELSYFAINEWNCQLFWWLFGLCSAFPALLESFLLIAGLLPKTFKTIV